MLYFSDLVKKQIVFIGFEFEQINNLKVVNENLVIYNSEGKLINKISLTRVFCVFLIGEFTLTSKLIEKIKLYGASVYFIKRNTLKFYASIEAVAEGNFLLREKQYINDCEFVWSKELVKNKIDNQLRLLKKNNPIFFDGISRGKYYKEWKSKIDAVYSVNELLGIEGNFAKSYFPMVFSNFHWYRRMPRTGIDQINVLLDLGYSLLLNYIDCLLRVHGFDTYKGFYHKLYFQRKSLSCDLVEPFRPIIDYAIVKSYNLSQFDLADFKKSKNGFELSYKSIGKYCRIFANEIIKNQEGIYDYVRKFYFFVLDSKASDFPIFKMKI